jgi:hypothetical protein
LKVSSYKEGEDWLAPVHNMHTLSHPHLHFDHLQVSNKKKKHFLHIQNIWGAFVFPSYACDNTNRTEQGWQCTYNSVARFVQPLLWWRSNKYFIDLFWVFVTLVIQHAMNMHHIALCGLPALLYSIFPHDLIKAWFLKSYWA